MADGEKTHPEHREEDPPPVVSSATPDAFTGVPVWEETGEWVIVKSREQDDGDGATSDDDDENPTETTRQQRGEGGRRLARNDGMHFTESFGPRERLAFGLLAVGIAVVALLPFLAVGGLLDILWTSERRVVSVELVEAVAELLPWEDGAATQGAAEAGAASATLGVGDSEGASSLTAATFRPFLEHTEQAFINFDTPWCVWCQRLRPTWDAFAAEARARSPHVAVCSVDCVAEPELCKEERIMAFPTLRWYNGRTTVSPDYKMDRTVEAFMKFAEMKVKAPPEDSSVAVVDEEEQEEDVGGEAAAAEGDADETSEPQVPTIDEALFSTDAARRLTMETFRAFIEDNDHAFY